MKIWILSAVCKNVVLPLCYTNTEQEMLNYIKPHRHLWRLYNEEALWIEESGEFDQPNPCVPARDYFRMFEAE